MWTGVGSTPAFDISSIQERGRMRLSENITTKTLNSKFSILTCGPENLAFLFNFVYLLACGSVVVKALCYKAEGREFDTR
jgi:hypothetical protein